MILRFSVLVDCCLLLDDCVVAVFVNATKYLSGLQLTQVLVVHCIPLALCVCMCAKISCFKTLALSCLNLNELKK